MSIAGCESIDPASDRSIRSGVDEGTVLVLHEALQIPAGRRRVHISFGKVTRDPHDFDVTCYFRVRNEDTILVKADRFLVTEFRRDREEVRDGDIERYIVRYELRSESQPEVMRLVCNKWDSGNIGRPITQAQVIRALGDLVTFETTASTE